MRRNTSAHKPNVDSSRRVVFNQAMSKYHPDSKLIELLGGPTAVAAMLGYDKPGSVQRVQNWKYRGIPEVIRLRRQDIFGPAEGIRHAR